MGRYKTWPGTGDSGPGSQRCSMQPSRDREKQSPFTITWQLAEAEPMRFSALQMYSPRSNLVVLLSFKVATPAVKASEHRLDSRSFPPALNQDTEISGVPSMRHRSNNESPSLISTGSILSTKHGRSAVTTTTMRMRS